LRGDIQGFAVATKQITSSYTVTEDDCVISCYNPSGITVSLPTPSSVQIGKVYIIKAINSTVTVAGSLFATEQLSTRNITKGYATIFVNDGQFWILISYT
jgi:hypothetical protein